MKKISRQLLRNTFASLLLVALLSGFVLPQTSYGDVGIERKRTCQGNGSVEGLTSGFDTVPLGDSDDLVIDFSNGVCFSQLFTAYLTVKGNIANMNRLCGTGSSVRPEPSIFLDAIDIAKATANAPSKGTACQVSIPVALGSLTGFMALFAVTYEIAEDTYDDARICGAGWTTPNTETYEINGSGHRSNVTTLVNGYIEAGDSASLSFDNKTYREWYYGGVEVEDRVYEYTTNFIDVDIDKSGMTVEDYEAHYGVDTCRDPAASPSNYPRQKYYMRGSQVSNFNCERYEILAGQDDPLYVEGAANAAGITSPISKQRLADFQKAYGCCKERRRNYICIDYAGEQTFCKAGSRCNLTKDGLFVTFEATREENNLICASTYSLCPYNFSIAGGTRKCERYQDGKYDSDSGRYEMITPEIVESGNCANGVSEIRNNDCTFNNKAGKCKNYCQQLTHCTTTNDSYYEYESSLTSPYFSSACLDFKGDSRNEVSYNSGVILGSQRHFSAPIAQCVKETLENVFHNRFGRSICASSDESPSPAGICADNNYQNYDGGSVRFKKGEQVSSQSFFSKLQHNLQLIVKLALTFAVMFYGVKVMLGGGGIKKSDILKFLLKMGLVLYFATGTAWQNQFFDGVYGASSELSRIVFKIDVSTHTSQRDGCQFGNITTAGGTVINTSIRPYPEGKEYLALWDTLDCKIARYLGFGPEATEANIAKLIFAGFLTGPYGVYFAIALMFFGFFFLAATIRALHIFLSSAIAILIMVYVSPIIIPTVMFSKTANLFKSWLTNLIGFCLQPMILFAYIAIFITIMDKTLIGSATFHGPGPNKTISCEEYCADSIGNKVSMTLDPACSASDPCNANVDQNCDKPGNNIIVPMNNSFACLIGVDSYGNFPGLEIIGIGIPILTNFFEGDVTQKILTLVKAALVMYVLCQFMDQIPEVASYLVGGANLGGGSGVLGEAKNMMMKTAGATRAFQKRAGRGSGKLKNAATNKAKDLAKRFNSS